MLFRSTAALTPRCVQGLFTHPSSARAHRRFSSLFSFSLFFPILISGFLFLACRRAPGRGLTVPRRAWLRSKIQAQGVRHQPYRLRLMASAPNIGLSSTENGKKARRPADSERVVKEVPNCFLVFPDHRPAQRTAHRVEQFALIRTMSADSMATSVPAPIAMPTSERTRAGASLMPSPTMATLFPLS